MTGCIAIIPAKGTSSRIPRKNIRMFHGKPIIAYSIEAALRALVFDAVVVSTDDNEVANIAALSGAKVYRRAKELTDDSVGTQEVTADALCHLPSYEYACCIYPTAPLMRVEDLNHGLAWLRNRKDSEFAFSVGTEPLRDAGQFYWGRSHAFAYRYVLFGPASLMIPIDESRVCDINTLDDWSRAEAMYAALHR